VDFWRRQNWNLAGRAGLWYSISGVIIALGVVALVTQGLNLGIDFTGGSLYKYKCQQPIAASSEEAAQVIGEVRGLLAGIGIERSQIQVSDNNLILIRTATLDSAQAEKQGQDILTLLRDKLGQRGGTIDPVGVDQVGPVIAKELFSKAIVALVIGNLLILIFLTARYEFRFAVAAIVALLHDVIIVVGAMALFQVELNSEFVAALLTVVGYSVNDSVVIFDRIRENRRLHRGVDFQDTVNASLLQTMARSINTTLTLMVTLLALFFFGGATIHPFALALVVGMTSGAYSSIFVASPLLVSWHRWSQKRRGEVVTTARRRAPAAGPLPSVQPVEPAPESTGSLSAEQALKRAQSQAQEEKREARRQRRKKKSGGKGKRRH